MSDRGDAVRRLVASLEKDEQETKTVRADLEALQAAVRGLTGREGTVSEMVTDLASVGRAMAALKAAVEAATGQRRDKVVDLIADLGAMSAAWAEAERREDEARRIGEATHIDLMKEESVRRGAQESLRKAIAEREDLDGRLQAAARVASTLRTLVRGGDEPALQRLDDLDKALRGMPLGDRPRGREGTRFHATVATIEDRLAEVERLVGSMSDHLAALDQRIAGLGNGLDEVRRPKVALVAGSNGSLDAWSDRGDQVGGVMPAGTAWEWYARRAFGPTSAGYDVPTREEALAAMTRVLETWAEIVDGAPK